MLAGTETGWLYRLLNRLFDKLPLATRPYSFRFSTSCSIYLSSYRSATIRFSRVFSSSSSFRRFISDGIKPP